MAAPQRSEVHGGWQWLAITLVLLLASCGRAADGAAISPAAAASAKTADPGGCQITRPPDRPFVPPAPPAPTSPAVRGGEFWYGTPALWTSLQLNGTWNGLPYQDREYTQKVFWWSQGYEWTSPLTVTGKRVDGTAPPLRASPATNAFAGDIGTAILVGVDMPSAGCWEITGHLKGATVSFVVWIPA
jgi:hypothetical protein